MFLKCLPNSALGNTNNEELNNHIFFIGHEYLLYDSFLIHSQVVSKFTGTLYWKVFKFSNNLPLSQAHKIKPPGF